MKANEAPEKLYIDFRDRAECTWRCAYTEKALANDIRYTRTDALTDAFIEKAERYIRSIADGLDRDDDVETFISGFKNYMKGE